MLSYRPIHLVLFLMLFLSCTVKALDCNCAYVVEPEEVYVDARKLKIVPGDTICIKASQKEYLQFKNFEGDSANPLVFINYKGVVDIANSNFSYGMKFSNCRFFKLLGLGDTISLYGIRIHQTGPGASGLVVTELSSDFEVAHLEVSGTGFAGIMAKTDPDCEEKINRSNYQMKNISFHHNYVHDVYGEGLYIGHSFYNGWKGHKDCSDKLLYPHAVLNLHIYDNLVERTGYEGIQVGSAVEGILIYDNRIFRFGMLNEPQQNNGMQIGEGTSSNVYNNLISSGQGHGIIHLGRGENYIYNNIISDCGASGIFCDNRMESIGDVNYFINNTFTYPAENGITLYSDTARSYCLNNLVINPGNYFVYEHDSTSYTGQDAFIFLLHRAADVELDGNCFLLNDFPKGDDPSAYSYLSEMYDCIIDGGVDAGERGVKVDMKGIPRPLGKSFDAGAIEFE